MSVLDNEILLKIDIAKNVKDRVKKMIEKKQINNKKIKIDNLCKIYKKSIDKAIFNCDENPQKLEILGNLLIENNLAYSTKN